jgi:hypothetical protein
MSTTALSPEFDASGLALFEKLKPRLENLSETGATVTDLTTLIQEGKESFNNGDHADAEKKYDQALKRLRTIELSRQSTSLAHRLLGIEAAYLLVLLLLGYGTYKWPTFGLWSGLVNIHLQTAWFGALGGVSIAIYGIYEHVQKQDFDPNFELWYLCKPVIGAIFGWFVFLIYVVGFVSVQGVEPATIQTKEVPFVIAFLAGFSERFTLKMVDKLMSVLTTWQDQTGTQGGSQTQTKP